MGADGSLYSAVSAVTVTPNDSTTLTQTRAIYVGTTGNLAVVMADGTTPIFTTVPAGALLPIQVTKVLATGTGIALVQNDTFPLTQNLNLVSNRNGINSVGLYDVVRRQNSFEVYKSGAFAYGGYQNNYATYANKYSTGYPLWFLGGNAASPDYSDAAVWWVGAWATSAYQDEIRLHAQLLSDLAASVHPAWVV